MELNDNEKLQILTSKALDLHERMQEKINERGFRLCSHCWNHGGYCAVAGDEIESNRDERERMIAIRDSLKELHRALISLQKVRSTHERQRDEALARLQESRKVLVERVNLCSQKLHVLDEVIDFSLNFEWEMEEKNNVNGIYRFLVNTTRFGLEFAVVFATIYTLSKSRQHTGSRIQTDKPGFLLTHSDVHLDVLCGRG